MTIVTGMCTGFKRQCMMALHNLQADGDAYKIALYTSLATLNNRTTGYPVPHEVVGQGYTAGGAALINIGTGLNYDANEAYATFEDVSWPNSRIKAAGAMIYRVTGGYAVSCHAFPQELESYDDDFYVGMPPQGAGSSVLRFV